MVLVGPGLSPAPPVLPSPDARALAAQTSRPSPTAATAPAAEVGVTVAQWAETWWQTIDVGANTEAFYRTLLTRHILPQWGATPLTALTPAGIEIWLKKLRDSYAQTTVKSIRKLLGMILADAVDNRLIDRTPVRSEHRGRGRLQPHRERPWIDEHQLLTIARRILRVSCRNHCLLVITAAYTGMRWGELAGLQRDNVDLERGLVHITHNGALHEVNGALSLGHPKTRASVRTVTLPPFLTALLTADLSAHRRDFVFTTLRGALLRRSGFQRRVWAPATRGGTIDGRYWTPVDERLTFHGLRHSHKTWLIEDGNPDVAQARRLGHTLQNRMDETYSHVAASIDTRLLAGLENRWQRSLTAANDTNPADPLALTT
ncbi:tyrosine-type recombinase/integrase [Streptomyces sp. 4N509B]|uniref:tyrosine-type recombinase/integrase n=1 Tax=Streptomyces sp. 4N509B TaxID=3457413 RepID=UPI003FD05322